MLEALIAGEESEAEMAARGRLRARIPDLRQALQGRITPHHRVLLRCLLQHLDFLDNAIELVQQEIDAHLQRDAEATEALTLLRKIPGINAVTAEAILAEIGPDMSRFPSAKHLASWAGVCPGNKQSGGRLRASITHGSPWLRGALGEVAWAVSRSKSSYLAAQFARIARRRGKFKAVMAVAHTILVIIYAVLRDHTPYTDLGSDYFGRLDQERVERHHVRRLEALGYTVTLVPASA